MAEARQDAAVFLSGQPLDGDSMATQLLADVREVFCRLDVDRMSSEQLVQQLTEDATSIWTAYPKD
jgi:hypothetical protein